MTYEQAQAIISALQGIQLVSFFMVLTIVSMGVGVVSFFLFKDEIKQK